MDEGTARLSLVAAAQRLDAAGLNTNSSGNLGVRVDAGVLVTPSGIPPTTMTAADCVLLDLDGRVLAGDRAPSSEWRLHTAVLRARPDVWAIVHTHSPEATAASALRRTIPPVHYVAARFGGTLACAPYATYGTADLAEGVVRTLGADRAACLMANHGAVALGSDLDSAVALALDVEWFCGVHRRAVQLGDPVVLPDEEVRTVAELFRTYGQPDR